MEQPANTCTTLKKEPAELSKAERDLAKAIGKCRAKIEGGNPSSTYLDFVREYAGLCDRKRRLHNLLDNPPKGQILSDDMSREDLVSCLIDEEKKGKFYKREGKSYRKEIRLSKTRNKSAGAFTEDASPNAGGASLFPPPPPDDTSMASATAVANPSPDGSLLAAAVPTTRDSVSGGASTPIEARPPVDVLITPGRDDIGTTGTGDCELPKSKPKISNESAGSNADGAAHIEHLSQSSTGISRPQDVAAADLPIGPLIQQILPCRARSFVPPDHTEETAYLIIPPNVPHGFELKCSHPECEKFYKFCALCNTATIKNKFNERHSHTKREYGSRDATPASEPTISLTPKKRRKSLSRKASKAQRITTESSPSNKTSGLQLSDDKDVATNKPKARRSRTVAPELTENEEETIQLMEESKLARGGGDNLRADWKYVKKYASKTLRPAINAANSRNMKARLLRGCSARSTEELKAITMLRQEEVRKGLQSKELEWLGDKGHYRNTNSSSMERSTTLIPASLLTSDEEESNNSINGSPLQDIYDSDEDEDDDYPSDDTDTNLDSEDLTRAEEDFAVLSQESMFLCDNDQGRRNFVYIDKFASKSLKELMASLETQGYQHQTSMLVPKRKMKALLRLQDQTRRKLEDDKCYSQRVKARLIEALGREKATAIIAGPSRKPSTPVFTPSPKKKLTKGPSSCFKTQGLVYVNFPTHVN